MSEMISKTVANVLRDLPKSEKVYYRANPGNAGDALIATGTFHLFDDLGLNYEIIDDSRFDPKDKTIVYAGGGNLNHIYSDARVFMKATHTIAKKFILLPHTVTGNEDLLAEMEDNCIIFARESISYDHLLQHCTRCNVHLDHDMALNMDLEKILCLNYPNSLSLVLTKLLNKFIGSKYNHIPSIKKLVGAQVMEWGKSKYGPGRVGMFFRNDAEASGIEIAEGNADLSVVYEFGTLDREYTDYTVWRLLKYIDRFEEVKTDRLHICLASAMLNKKVEFYSNSYFKCKAVFEYSLRDMFPNIYWKGRGEVLNMQMLQDIKS